MVMEFKKVSTVKTYQPWYLTCRTAHNCRLSVQRNCLHGQLNPWRPAEGPDIRARLSKVKVSPRTDLLQTTASNWFKTASFILISWCCDQKAPCCFSYPPPPASHQQKVTSSQPRKGSTQMISDQLLFMREEKICCPQWDQHKTILKSQEVINYSCIPEGCSHSCWLSSHLPPLQLWVPPSTQPVSSISNSHRE